CWRCPWVSGIAAAQLDSG
nr:immunoglobulin heavy chain junction region [Macaca mulatta]MOX91728.1 immunoglobulin heavy chain junction region [Macaca mulatta]MOX92251.1 immunoglobulin heavy chain junction region [Macaca mulatta]MOX93363.1 immunoglobulin heavy chain junction region [Macaca mulatta]MOX93531.1 immunoglobulin heavy chain junction region [Macaca mulatta]